MAVVRWAVALLALASMGLSIWQLEQARAGLEITQITRDDTPITEYRQRGIPGPTVVIAHGFAGSRQLMEAYALTLAHGGYRVVSFDFEGHGRNTVPMGGDVNAIDGTTRRLIDQTRRVIDHALEDGSMPVALLGHSMASDVIIRSALEDPRVGTVVAVSAFSRAVTAEAPSSLLLISGALEGQLRRAALSYVQMAEPTAAEEDLIDRDGLRRQAIIAPGVEHVGVLYSATGLAAARAWLDAAFEREPSAGPVAATGGWIALLLAGALALAWPLSALLPRIAPPPPPLPMRLYLSALVLPAVVTPVALRFVEVNLLPVLIADYLALHLAVYGLLALAVLWRGGVRSGALAVWPSLALAVYGIAVFGGALDRYAASFMPSGARGWIIAAVALGAVPFMCADALLTRAGAAPYWQRLVARLAFFASLAGAVALDFEQLFFLIIILPVIVLFFVIFGQMGSWAGRRTGAPLVPGVALGLCLAWAIGVSFPMFTSERSDAPSAVVD